MPKTLFKGAESLIRQANGLQAVLNEMKRISQIASAAIILKLLEGFVIA